MSNQDSEGKRRAGLEVSGWQPEPDPHPPRASVLRGKGSQELGRCLRWVAIREMGPWWISGSSTDHLASCC